MGFSKDNLKGFVLALLSSGFIGASFIIKKKGLRRAAAATGIRAGVGGYAYLLEPLWWLGMITIIFLEHLWMQVIIGEVANFVAYAFAPAVLVTPLGALSLIVSAVLAQYFLNEKLQQLGILGCVMCIAGSIIIVIHAPQEQPITSVQEVWTMATQPAFLLYVGSVIVLVFILIFYFAPQCGHTNVLVFTGICSLIGSLSVMSVKALGTSLKLTFESKNQLMYPETWIFMCGVATCVIMQMNYLNKALDTFNTAIVSPIYYVMFTSLTILASVIMFKMVCNRIGKVKVLGISYQKYVPSSLYSPGPSCCIRPEREREILKEVHLLEVNYMSLSPTLSARLYCENGDLLRHEYDQDEECGDESRPRRQQLHARE